MQPANGATIKIKALAFTCQQYSQYIGWQVSVWQSASEYLLASRASILMQKIVIVYLLRCNSIRVIVNYKNTAGCFNYFENKCGFFFESALWKHSQ